MFGMSGEKRTDFEKSSFTMCENVTMYRAELMIKKFFSNLVDLVETSSNANYLNAVVHAMSLLDRQDKSTRHSRKYTKTKVLTVVPCPHPYLP